MKLHKIYERTQTLPFTEFDSMKKYREGFKKSELGLIYEKSPLKEMASTRIIGTLRATVMGGSFGNQKQHYSVGRIAARNRHNETLLLFFGIHMANAATLVARDTARRKERERQLQRA